MITAASYWTEHRGLGLVGFGAIFLACLLGPLINGIRRHRRRDDQQDQSIENP